MGSAPSALDGHPQREWRRTWLLRHTLAPRPSDAPRLLPMMSPYHYMPEEITLYHPKNIINPIKPSISIVVDSEDLYIYILCHL